MLDIDTDEKLHQFLRSLTKDELFLIFEKCLHSLDKEKLIKAFEGCLKLTVNSKIFEPKPLIPGIDYTEDEGYSINTEFNDQETCLKMKDLYMARRKNTNCKYRHFTQSVFTSADRQQFIRHGLNKTLEPFVSESLPSLKENVWSGKRIMRKFEYTKPNILSTFDYLNDYIKKGIYVQIYNNELNVYLPFNNAHFKNTWHQKLIPPEPYSKRRDGLYQYALKNTRLDNRTTVDKRISRWYSNNCIFRNAIYNHKNPKDLQFKPDEGDKGAGIFLLMFKSLCKKRKIPNCQFFINYRDFPVLKKDFTEPYDAIWKPDMKVPDIKKRYKFPKIPILSECGSDKFADILIPTDDDMERILKKYIFPFCRDIPHEIEMTPWSQKKEEVIFRGGMTGCGTTLDSNVRMKLAYLSKFTDKFDAGLTGMNRRIKKDPKNKILNIIEVNDEVLETKKKPEFYGINKPFKPVKIKDLKRTPIDRKSQSEYKYLISPAGHVSQFRFSLELSYGSVILKVDTPYKLWFESKLVKFDLKKDNYKTAHFIPIKSDLSNLIPIIDWCKKNDKKCEQIGKNAREFYKTYLTEKGVLDFWQALLTKLV